MHLLVGWGNQYFCFLPSNYSSNKRGRQLQFEIPWQLSAQRTAVKCPCLQKKARNPIKQATVVVSTLAEVLGSIPGCADAQPRKPESGVKYHSPPEAGRWCPHPPRAKQHGKGHRPQNPAAGHAQGGIAWSKVPAQTLSPGQLWAAGMHNLILVPGLGCKLFL